MENDAQDLEECLLNTNDKHWKILYFYRSIKHMKVIISNVKFNDDRKSKTNQRRRNCTVEKVLYYTQGQTKDTQ